MNHNTKFAADATLTLGEIAELLDRDPKTVKTWRAQGRWPHATQDDDGRRAWRVPVTDLVTAGDLAAAEVEEVGQTLSVRRESRALQALREQVVRLEEQLRAAEALAEERAATIAILRSVLGQAGSA